MKNIELKIKVIIWLEEQDKIFQKRPCSFTPKQVAEAVGGAYSAVGQIQEEVVVELIARGVRIRYVKQSKDNFFELI